MTDNTNCGICGIGIDRGACSQTWRLHTQDIDENEKHRKERMYLCESCNRRVRTFITETKLKERIWQNENYTHQKNA